MVGSPYNHQGTSLPSLCFVCLVTCAPNVEGKDKGLFRLNSAPRR